MNVKKVFAASVPQVASHILMPLFGTVYMPESICRLILVRLYLYRVSLFDAYQLYYSFPFNCLAFQVNWRDMQDLLWKTLVQSPVLDGDCSVDGDCSSHPGDLYSKLT